MNEPVAQAEPLHVVAKDAEAERKRQQAHLKNTERRRYSFGENAARFILSLRVVEAAERHEKDGVNEPVAQGEPLHVVAKEKQNVNDSKHT